MLAWAMYHGRLVLRLIAKNFTPESEYNDPLGELVMCPCIGCVHATFVCQEK